MIFHVASGNARWSGISTSMRERLVHPTAQQVHATLIQQPYNLLQSTSEAPTRGLSKHRDKEGDNAMAPRSLLPNQLCTIRSTYHPSDPIPPTDQLQMATGSVNAAPPDKVWSKHILDALDDGSHPRKRATRGASLERK